ncbi:AAA family ATPase [Blastopirellula marina]|uniref:AAA family ATPase n=1 Tax=Blastopirellula marina TaxID=124 RepID=UPI001E4F088A|nr:AAA family ATPase [Blastopirellula marina]
MSDPLKQLLSQLAGEVPANSNEEDSWELVEAISPEEEEDKSLEAMISRINSMTSKGSDDEGIYAQKPEEKPQQAPVLQEDHDTPFYPCEPQSLKEAQLTGTDVESLCLKYLLTAGEASGREIAAQLCLPFLVLDECLRKMKYDQLVVYKDTAQAGDYVYFLTDLGRERARRYNEHCTYYGAAPVSLKDYIASVRAQSLEGQSPSIEALEQAFEDLLINKAMFRRLGPAINSGRGLFLYGAPGNGKTSIAERVTRAFGRYIWVPRAIGIEGEIMRVFDPAVHDEVPLEDGPGILQQNRIDRRWVRIKRPTIVVGGELTMDNLEISTIQSTGVSEAPLQLKSNCGTLVIDDFGRQRMSTDELLNRWIVPLEKRYDFLNMRGGKKIQVPFDQLIVFSTNLEPRDLCDDAFLRRIPYKIEVIDPSETEFRQLFDIMCPMLGFTYNEEAIDYLIENHYRKVNRPFRCCQPRDLLMQVRNMCLYENAPLALSKEHFDDAVENYFAVM